MTARRSAARVQWGDAADAGNVARRARGPRPRTGSAQSARQYPGRRLFPEVDVLPVRLPGLFAAYNAGPARYAAYLATGRALPAETRSYLLMAQAPPRSFRATNGRTPASLFAVARAAREFRPFRRNGELFVRLGNAERP